MVEEDDRCETSEAAVGAYHGFASKQYICVAGVVFLKQWTDPSRGNIRKATKTIGTPVYSTGRTWTGPSGGLWAELDKSQGERGWMLIRGRGFALPSDTALVDGSSAEEVAICVRRALRRENSETGEDWPTRPLTEEEWQNKLPSEVYGVLREKDTEPAYSGEYNKFYPESGHFICRGCEEPLYSAASKFKSGCGWPSFSKCYVNEDGEASVVVQVDWGGGREILCRVCAGHLGHVFKDGSHMGGDTLDRHCVNSLSITYEEELWIRPEVLSDEGPFLRQMETHNKHGSYPTVGASED